MKNHAARPHISPSQTRAGGIAGAAVIGETRGLYTRCEKSLCRFDSCLPHSAPTPQAKVCGVD